MSFINDPFVVAQMAKAQQLVNEQLRAKYNPDPIMPNAGIPTQYTQQQSAQPSGLFGGDSMAPMRAFQQMYGRQGSPAQMQQNRQAYQSQNGTPESLAPMQTLNQYRGTQGAAPGAAPTAGGK